MKNPRQLLRFAVVGAAFATAAFIVVNTATAAPPFGSKSDAAYAKAIWKSMVAARLVGKGSIKVRPFEGNEPHGTIQEVLATTAKIKGHAGRLVIKRNHAGKGVSVEDVYDNPTKYLKAITIMFKREKGYDKDNHDWFWAKFTPKGDLAKNPKGMMLAGRVAKGMKKGCIACHSGAGGKDMEVLTSK